MLLRASALGCGTRGWISGFALTAGVTAGLAVPEASAQWGYEPRIARDRVRPTIVRIPRERRQLDAQPKAAKAQTQAQAKPVYPNLMAVVSIGAQRVTVYDHTGAIMNAPVSTGQAGHRTPTGLFSIIQKNRYHESNIYSGAPMPYMQRITWSGIAMHEGALPGYPASHGCIRLPGSFASKLFGMTKLGMRVVVAPHDVQPTAFRHAALPVPLMTPAVADSAPGRQTAAQPIKVAASEGTANDAGGGDAGGVVTRFDTPYQRALAERTKARGAAEAAKKLSKTALEESQRASAEANEAAADYRAALVSQADAETMLGRARAAVQAAGTPETLERARIAVADAEVRAADMAKLVIETKGIAEARSQEAFAAAVASREADEAIEATEKTARLAEKAVEPISIFISRKEGKLFARQGFTPMFDTPVTFKGDAPLGTHLFVAMAGDEASGGLSWTAVTVPNNLAPQVSERQPVKRGHPAPSEPAVMARHSTASEVLDRIEIPDDIKRKISERTWVGAAVTISDNGHSSETGIGTDFVVLTR